MPLQQRPLPRQLADADVVAAVVLWQQKRLQHENLLVYFPNAMTVAPTRSFYADILVILLVVPPAINYRAVSNVNSLKSLVFNEQLKKSTFTRLRSSGG